MPPAHDRRRRPRTGRQLSALDDAARRRPRRPDGPSAAPERGGGLALRTRSTPSTRARSRPAPTPRRPSGPRPRRPTSGRPRPPSWWSTAGWSRARGSTTRRTDGDSGPPRCGARRSGPDGRSRLDDLHDALGPARRWWSQAAGEARSIAAARGTSSSTLGRRGRGRSPSPTLVVRAGADSEVTVCVHHRVRRRRSAGRPLVELDVGAGRPARLLERPGPRPPGLAARPPGQPGRADATCSPGWSPSAATTPAWRIDSALVGGRERARCLAVYFGERRQMHDLRTVQDHVAPSTTLEPAVQGRRRGPLAVGLHRPHPHREADGRGSNAFQTNRNVKLSDGVRGPSRCRTSRSRTTTCTAPTHRRSGRSTRTSASTSRAAACRRGSPSGSIVLGFFDEVLDRLPAPAASPRRFGPRWRPGSPARGATAMSAARPPSGSARRRRRRGRRADPLRRRRPPVVRGAIRRRRLYAVGDICTHADVSLSRGRGRCATPARSSAGSTAAPSTW